MSGTLLCNAGNFGGLRVGGAFLVRDFICALTCLTVTIFFVPVSCSGRLLVNLLIKCLLLGILL